MRPILFASAFSLAAAVGGQATAQRSGQQNLRDERAVVAAANQHATLGPAAAGYVNAAQVYPYSEGGIYRVYAAPGRVTDIALQPGEQLGAVASGDTVRWVIGDTTSGAGGDKRVHILIKPFAGGLATNLVITTERRTYHLALSSAVGAAMTAVSWSYPQDALIALQRQSETQAVAEPTARGLDVEQLRFDYAITGDKPSWRPLRAFDDGRQTYIEFAPTLAVGEAPPLFLVDPKGGVRLVNYRVHGRFYIVDRLFDVAELRLGTQHQEIVRIVRTAPAHAGKRS
ncbi:P-type conjugative transfer protein TrbG [Sphingomonas sp. 1P08PE]|uniref:P-type conjugative transfer protein TrbG n=1 Tax=Sphingomonas sp. 1P08PE TaxID=554122 RepID=UPI0039A07150